MKRIDIIGVPGVGKTALLNAMLKVRKDSYWLSSDEAKKQVLNQYFKKDHYSGTDYIKSAGSWLIFQRRYVPLDEEKFKKFITRHFNPFDFVIESSLRYLSNDQGTASYVKAKRISLLLRTLEDILLLEHHIPNRAIVFDESLTSKLFSYVLDTNKLKNGNGMEYTRKFHLPDGFIFMKADEKTIIERLSNRNRTTWAHHRLKEHELAVDIKKRINETRLASETLSAMNIRGIIIDTSGPINENVQNIQDFLRQFKHY